MALTGDDDRVDDGRTLTGIGHPDVGDRAAVIYSLIVSIQRRGLDPHAYLKDVLTRLPAMTTKDDLTPLLPTHWKSLSAS